MAVTLKWIVLVYVALVLRSNAAPSSLFAIVDPLLAVAVLAVLSLGHPAGFLTAAAIGLLFDLLWSDRLGASMVSFAVAGYALGGLRRWFESENAGSRCAAAALLGTSMLLIRGLILELARGSQYGLEAILLRSLWDGCLAGALSLGLHAFLGRLESWIGSLRPAPHATG